MTVRNFLKLHEGGVACVSIQQEPYDHEKPVSYTHLDVYKRQVDWQDSHKYITYTDLAREQAGEKACKIRDNKLEKYYNLSLIHI